MEKIATDASPVINVVFASRRDLRETTKMVDDRIKKNIESLNGVGQVRFVGDRSRQIQVWLDGEKLYSYDLNIDQVRAALAAQNVEIPGGRVDQGSRELSLRTLGRVERPQDFERIIVANVGGRPVRIADIGHVEDGVEEPRSLARLDGAPAVVLEVRKQAGTNTLDVIQHGQSADRRADAADAAAGFPGHLYARSVRRSSPTRFKAVQEHLMLGGFFAGYRRAVLHPQLALHADRGGRDSHVHHFHLHADEHDGLHAEPDHHAGAGADGRHRDRRRHRGARKHLPLRRGERTCRPCRRRSKATRDIGLAVLATTLSLVIIFLPVAMMDRHRRQVHVELRLHGGVRHMVSLLVSFTLTPMLCSRFLKPSGRRRLDTKDTVIFRAFAAPYRAHAALVDDAPLGDRSGLAAGDAFHRAAVHDGRQRLPAEGRSERIRSHGAHAAGLVAEGTDEVMQQLEAELKQLPGIRHMLTTIGADIAEAGGSRLDRRWN